MRPHLRPASPLAKALAVSTLMLAAAACTPALDTEALETDLQGKVSDETGARITQVDCPEVKAETGGTFECTATDESGATFVLMVTQTNDKGAVVYKYVNAEVPSTPSPTA